MKFDDLRSLKTFGARKKRYYMTSEKGILYEVIPVTVKYAFKHRHNDMFPIVYDVNSKQFFEHHDRIDTEKVLSTALKEGKDLLEGWEEVKSYKLLNFEELAYLLIEKEFKDKIETEDDKDIQLSEFSRY